MGFALGSFLLECAAQFPAVRAKLRGVAKIDNRGNLSATTSGGNNSALPPNNRKISPGVIHLAAGPPGPDPNNKSESLLCGLPELWWSWGSGLYGSQTCLRTSPSTYTVPLGLGVA